MCSVQDKTSMLRKAHTRNSQSTGTGFIAHEGYLIKQGGARGGFKNWKRRWFAIKRDCLYYYKSRPTTTPSTASPDLNESDQLLLGVLPLLGANVVDIGNDPANLQLNTVCYECKRPFSMIQKRHICSICSQTFCKQCLGHKVSIPSMGFDKPVKACRPCYDAVVHDQQVRDQSDSPDKALKSRLTAEAGDRAHVFLIQTPDRELLVQADSAEQKSEWMAALREAIGKRRSGHLSDPLGLGLKPAKEHWEIDYSQLTFVTKIGDGAFGEVYKGRLWGSDVAIKKLKDSEVNDKVLSDLKKEVAILSQLRHPNIVLYIGACTQPPNICIVTEWCDRGSLYDIIYKQKMIIDTRRAMNIAIGLAQGMSYLHSLDANIIHRDLKSHNVLLDSSFTVKIADFGLSHMRELNVDVGADTDAGKFGIFGTPEWMAPEVMEGSAYTNKIDVYSFGVVLTEIFNRQVPLRDQYKISTYVDVFEAVLDDGARPTIPDWVGSTLQNLIQDCLNVIPSKRPTFMDLIARLTQAFHMSPKMIVKQYDVKRLIFMLDNTRPYMQELAARELAQMKACCDICSNCGQCPTTTSMFEHDNIMLFVEKLSILFNGGAIKIKAQACAALVSLLSSAPDKYRSTYSDIVLKEISLGTLMQYCSSAQGDLGPNAAALVKQITLDLLRPHNDFIRELDRGSAGILENLVADEISQLSAKLDYVQEMVQLKRDFMLKLKQSQFNSERPSPSHRQTPSWHSTSFEMVAAPIEEMVVSGVVINKAFAAADIDVLPAPSPLSDIFLDTFHLHRPDIIDSDHGLVYDPMTSEWLVCLLVLLPRQIHIFERGAGQSADDACLAMVRVAANAPTQVAVGRKGAKPHCIHIIDNHDSIVICTRTAAQCRFWAAILCPDIFPPVHDLKPANTRSKMSTRELLDMLSENVIESRVPATSSSGWLLARDPDTAVWYPTYGHFPPAKPNVMTLYETSNMNNIIMSIKVDSVRHQYDKETPKSAPLQESEEWLSRLFSVSGMLVKHLDYRDEERSLKPITIEFCAVSIGDRHGWVSYCSRVCNRLPPIAADENDDFDGLETLPQDIKQQLMKSNDPMKTTSRTGTATTTTTSDVSASKTEPSSGSYSVDDAIVNDAATESKISPQSEFIRQFGQACKHGYLLKRGGFRKNWKLRYFYLVGNQLRYFPSHSSSPSECLGIIYTATGSGKRFSVYQDTTNSSRHRFCIENPGRIWFLEAHTEVQMKEWMSAIDTAAAATDPDNGLNRLVE